MKDKTSHVCEQIKVDGTRCQANARTGSKFCFFHDPEVAAKRTAARKAGGIERSRRAVLPADTPDRSLSSIDDVVALLGETINQTRTGTLDPKVANAVGYLSGILLKALIQGDLEQRLAELEVIVRNHRDEPGSIFRTDFRAEEGSLMTTGSALS